jgi:hypothetical protein
VAAWAPLASHGYFPNFGSILGSTARDSNSRSSFHDSLGRLSEYRLKPIAELMIGVNVANTTGVSLDPSAQLVDRYPQTLYLPRMLRPPNGYEQGVVRNRLPLMQHEISEKLEICRREMHWV